MSEIIDKRHPGKYVIEVPEGASALLVSVGEDGVPKGTIHTNTPVAGVTELSTSFCIIAGLAQILKTDLKLIDDKFKEMEADVNKGKQNTESNPES